MKLYSCLVILCLLGCEKSPVETNASSRASSDIKGLETIELAASKLFIFISASPHNFLHYQWALNDLWLENTKGEYFQIFPEDQPQNLTINWGEAVNQSHLLIQATVPADEYVAVVTFIDYSFAEILLERDGKIITPFLLDTIGNQLIDDNSLQAIKIAFNDKHLSAAQDKNTFMTLHLDPESSLRFMPLNDVDEDWLSTPFIEAEQGIRYSEATVYKGLVTEITNESLSFIDIGSYSLDKNTTELQFQQADLSYNGVPLTASALANKETNNLFVDINGAISKGQFDVQQLSFYQSTSSSLVKLSGLVNKNRFIGSVTSLESVTDFSQPMFVDLSLTPNSQRLQAVTGTGTYTENKIDNHNFKSKSSSIAFSQISSQEIEPLSFSGISMKFWQDVPGLNIPGQRIPDETYLTQGQFEQTQWQSDKVINIDEINLVYSLSLPLINTTNPLQVNTDSIGILPHDFAIHNLKSKGQPLYLDLDSYPVKHIHLNIVRGCIQLERLSPFSEIHCYKDQREFLSTLTEHLQNNFTVNQLIAEGQWQESGFVTKHLKLMLYANTPFNQAAEEVLNDTDTILQGKAWKTLKKNLDSFRKILLTKNIPAGKNTSTKISSIDEIKKIKRIINRNINKNKKEITISKSKIKSQEEIIKKTKQIIKATNEQIRLISDIKDIRRKIMSDKRTLRKDRARIISDKTINSRYQEIEKIIGRAEKLQRTTAKGVDFSVSIADLKADMNDVVSRNNTNNSNSNSPSDVYRVPIKNTGANNSLDITTPGRKKR